MVSLVLLLQAPADLEAFGSVLGTVDQLERLHLVIAATSADCAAVSPACGQWSARSCRTPPACMARNQPPSETTPGRSPRLGHRGLLPRAHRRSAPRWVRAAWLRRLERERHLRLAAAQ
eukprot:7452928-Heterocapsa_arctica.AAC.1